MTESFDLDSLVGEFREEAREQIDRVETELLRLEREGTPEPTAGGELLRTLHTLKGNAGMLGLSPIRDFVHVLENVLKSEEAWSATLVEQLLTGLAPLRSAIEAAGTAEQEAAFRGLTGTRHRLEALESRPAEPDPLEGTRPEAPSTGEQVRVPFGKLEVLMAEVGELIGDTAVLRQRLSGGPRDLAERAEAIHRRAGRAREAVMSLRLVPIGRILGRFHALVRRLARQQEKEARLVVEGEGTELDKSTADALGEPLLHLIRNAIDHGISSPSEREAAGKPAHGTIRIRAAQTGERVRVEVEDDGGGVDRAAVRERALELKLIDDGEPVSDRELLDLIFQPGFSTRAAVDTVSGQGVGLDVVARSVRGLRGDIRVESPPEGGTRFVLLLPLTVAIVPSLVLEVQGELLAVPTAHVVGTIRLEGTERLGAVEVHRSDAGLFPVAETARLFGWPSGDRGEFGVLVEGAGGRALLTADRLLDQRDLMLKALPPWGTPARAVSGGAVLPGGRVILVLDPVQLIRWVDAGQTEEDDVGDT